MSKDQEYLTILSWLAKGQVGSSSQSIAFTWCGIPDIRIHHPLDSGDFGRCYNLLKTCPFINIHVMRGKSPIWTMICDSWELLCKLYEKGEHARIYEEIKLIERTYEYKLSQALQGL